MLRCMGLLLIMLELIEPEHLGGFTELQEERNKVAEEVTDLVGIDTEFLTLVSVFLERSSTSSSFILPSSF